MSARPCAVVEDENGISISAKRERATPRTATRRRVRFPRAMDSPPSVYIQVRRTKPLNCWYTFIGRKAEANCEARKHSTGDPASRSCDETFVRYAGRRVLRRRVKRRPAPTHPCSRRRAWNWLSQRPRPIKEKATATGFPEGFRETRRSAGRFCQRSFSATIPLSGLPA